MRTTGVIMLGFLLMVFVCSAACQTVPLWADYNALTYQQQGESLYVAITFKAPVGTKGLLHAGNTFFNDYDDNLATGQPGNVGSETNLTFCDWDADNIWCMRVYAHWIQSVGGFVYRALVPVKVSADSLTISFKHSLVGLGLEDISYDCNGYFLQGSNWWNDPWNQGGKLDSVQLYSFNPASVPALDTTMAGAKSRLRIPASFKTIATTTNVLGALDEIVTVIESNIGAISPQKPYTVTYNAFSDYPVFVYNAKPNNMFTTYLPGGHWIDPPNWWAMLEGAVYQTMMELNAGYREVMATTMATDFPLPTTSDGWYATRYDSTHGLMWTTNHKVSFKAIIGRAYHNLMTIYIGEQLSHAAAKAAATAMRTQAANAYAGFSGNAFDLNPLIMTGFLLNKAGSDLSWVKTLWNRLPAAFLVPPADSLAPDAFGRMAKMYLRDGVADGSLPYGTRKYWYQNIASVQGAAIDVATGGAIYTELKKITNFPASDSVYTDAKTVFQNLVAVEEQEPALPVSFSLTQNFPNPFNPTTTIVFTLPERAATSLKVFDLLGREVATLFEGVLAPGEYTIPWVANPLPSGVYFYRLESGRFSAIKKAVLLK